MPGSVPTQTQDGRRPRVVMIVDNHITGDSRVQKTAVSVAAAGYDVVLVGRSTGSEVQESTLGAARVLKVPVPFHLLADRHANPGRSWRWPAAYPSRERRAYREARIDALRQELVTRRAQTKLRVAELRDAGPARRGVEGATLSARLLARRLAFRLRQDWHRLRGFEYRRAVRFRKAPKGTLNGLAAEARARLAGPGVWRRFDPLLWDYELAYSAVLDELRPDLIHAHDFRMVGVAVRAAARARGDGRQVRVVYDVHEFVPGIHSRSRRWQLANSGHEKEYIGRADAVVTVSETLAEMLQERYRLPRLPIVVLNAPPLDPAALPLREGQEEEAADHTGPAPDLRRACGLDGAVPLLVYSGSSAEQRGLRTMVEALPRLPGVHAAFVVANLDAAPVVELRRLAEQLGVADRVHLTGYVPSHQVAAFLSSATVGVIPILHYLNHEIALITKYFEYMHARLPIVVSDVRAMAAKTQELGNGEVFTAGDVGSFVTAAQAVLADPERYAKVYEATPGLLAQYSWERQAQTLGDLYARLLGAAGAGDGTGR